MRGDALMHLKRAMKYFFEHAFVQKTKKLIYRSGSNRNNDDDENNIRKITVASATVVHECMYVLVCSMPYTQFLKSPIYK